MRFRLCKPHFAPPFATVQRRNDDSVSTLPVPGFRQVRGYSCGYASALMVVRYYGLPVAGADLYRLLGTDRSGTRQTALVQALRQVGLRVGVRYDLDFAGVVRAIDSNKSIIAYLGDDEHWLVIYGYGRAPARVFVADPRPGQLCERLWESYGPRLGGFGLLCSPGAVDARPPAPASPAEREREEPRTPAQLVLDWIL